MRLERCQEKAQADLTRAIRLGEVELDRVNARARIERLADRDRIELLRGELASTAAWYRRPEFVATLTAVITIAAVIGTVYVYDAIAGGLR